MIASLTYARIRFYTCSPLPLRRLPRRGQADVLAGLADAGIGFGDVPVRHACTFSVWPSSIELDRVVLGRSEPHGIAVRRSNEENWLAESLFARFALVDHAGTWDAGDPLARQPCLPLSTIPPR